MSLLYRGTTYNAILQGWEVCWLLSFLFLLFFKPNVQILQGLLQMLILPIKYISIFCNVTIFNNIPLSLLEAAKICPSKQLGCVTAST